MDMVLFSLMHILARGKIFILNLIYLKQRPNKSVDKVPSYLSEKYDLGSSIANRNKVYYIYYILWYDSLVGKLGRTLIDGQFHSFHSANS